MMVRSSRTPTSAVARKATGIATKQVVRRPVHDRLHGVGRVRAEHQHLAVGHVDDAQEAEGDGQAERREQQHAGQRQAVQQIAHEADHALVA